MTWSPLGWARGLTKRATFALLRRVLASNEGRNLLGEALHCHRLVPLPDLGYPPSEEGRGTIIVTGRFRSGSTLLWNLFRHMKGFTAYYEPHNERRWFDPAARGSRVDPTHKGVSDYWAEYDGLTELGRFYREEWTWRDLYMDERSYDPALLEYTRILIARARGRAVLQCNRVDFRLAWFRRHFPACKVIHLHRNVRDQWCSALLDLKRFPPDGAVKDFGAVDGFYLLSWCRDLRLLFPFLAEETATHPYQLFYYLWKLSYLFGRRQSECSLSLEQLVADPVKELGQAFAATDIDPASQDVNALVKLIEKPRFGKWKEYASEDWFRAHEDGCERTLADFFRRNP